MKSLDDVTMITEKTAYPHKTTEINVTWENNTAKTLIFGEFFNLAKNVDSNWQKLSIPMDIRAIGYLVSPFSKTNHTYHLSIYKNLDAGEYRIGTHFFDDADAPITPDYEHYWLYAYFTLSGNDNSNAY